ncbi:MAG: hypothetical protein J0H60_01975 [Rhizobiales bacterium]|nr:hypothetical protein [Hyphomicrobiales bacterium]
MADGIAARDDDGMRLLPLPEYGLLRRMCDGRDIPCRRNNERNGLHIVRVNKALPATRDFAPVAGAHRVFAAFFMKRDVYLYGPKENSGSMPEKKNKNDDRYRYTKQP